MIFCCLLCSGAEERERNSEEVGARSFRMPESVPRHEVGISVLVGGITGLLTQSCLRLDS